MCENIKTVKNATCTFCGCVCDDMVLTVDLDEKRITKAKNACVLGRAWFAEHTIGDWPVAMIDGKEVSKEEAIEETAQTLVKAKFPIIYGLSDTTCEAQRQAVAISDIIRGTIDTTTSVCHGPSGLAFQGVGESTMSLGEVKIAPIWLFIGEVIQLHPIHVTSHVTQPHLKACLYQMGAKTGPLSWSMSEKHPVHRYRTYLFRLSLAKILKSSGLCVHL